MWKPITKRRRDFLTRALLGLLLFGAYIPVGFMPAAGTPFLLELCPAAAPLPMSADMDMEMDASMPMAMPMPAHHHPRDTLHHGGSHQHFETCPFGSAPGAGPPCLFVFSPPVQASASLTAPPASLPIASRSPRAHQARGPPSPA